jgi:hypothetical protein
MVAIAGAALVGFGGLAVVVLPHRGGKEAASTGRATATSTAGGGTGKTAGTTGTTPTTQPGSKAAEPPAWQPPKAGTYRYHFTRTGWQPADYDADDVIAAAGKSGFTESRDHKSALYIHTYAQRGQTVQETAFVLDSGTGRSECRWNSPFIVLPLRAKEGQTWSSKATCTMLVDKTSAAVEFESAARIVGVRTGKAGDTETPLLRIDRQVVLKTTANGQTAVRRSAFIDYYDTARGLLVQSTEDATETGPSGTTTYRIVEAMLTLQPEAKR